MVSFPKTFDGECHLMKGPPCHFWLIKGATPVAIHVSGPVDQPLLPRLKEENTVLEKQGIIRKVTELTSWVHPIVVVPKKGKGIRLCVDLGALKKYIVRPRFESPPGMKFGWGERGHNHVLDPSRTVPVPTTSILGGACRMGLPPSGCRSIRRNPEHTTRRSRHSSIQQNMGLSRWSGTSPVCPSCRTWRFPKHEEGAVRAANDEVWRIRGFREPLQTGHETHRRDQEIPGTEEQHQPQGIRQMMPASRTPTGSQQSWDPWPHCWRKDTYGSGPIPIMTPSKMLGRRCPISANSHTMIRYIPLPCIWMPFVSMASDVFSNRRLEASGEWFRPDRIFYLRLKHAMPW